MSKIEILEGKKLLIVDDEPDVLETLKDQLDMCDIDTATDFETGEKLLNQNKYDIAVLDIMGVKGYKLLEIAKKKGVPALILTAHALSPDNFVKAISEGAEAYIPKEKMAQIAIFLSDLLKSQEGTEKPHKWFYRLKSFFKELRSWKSVYNVRYFLTTLALDTYSSIESAWKLKRFGTENPLSGCILITENPWQQSARDTMCASRVAETIPVIP